MHYMHWTAYKTTSVSDVSCQVTDADVRPKCEKLQMAITQQRVIRSTSCFVLCWGFLASTDYIALFNLTAHELYYDRPTS